MTVDPDSTYTVGPARPCDVAKIAEIELAAAQMLEGYAPAHALEEVTAVHELREALGEGRLWIARAGDTVVGYACAEFLADGTAHLKEVDVHPGHVRRGLGARLVKAVIEWAAVQGAATLTLTTFRDVPFNRPFYARLGFEVVPPRQRSLALRMIVAEEHRRGFDSSRRVVMRYRCTARPVQTA